MRKLSKRLQEIFEWGSLGQYDHIYDICCDHGYLAYEFWKKSEAQIYAVDIAAAVVEKLKSRFTMTDQRFHILHAGGENIDYGENALVVIAGVGAHTTIEILEHLLSQSLEKLDIILCCHQNTDILREYLQKTDLGLAKEGLIVDNHKFYELMLMTTTPVNSHIELIGSMMWDQPNKDDLSQYLNKQLKYWGVKRDEKSYAILEAYKELSQKWES